MLAQRRQAYHVVGDAIEQVGAEAGFGDAHDLADLYPITLKR